jgi:hypothetical protein
MIRRQNRDVAVFLSPPGIRPPPRLNTNNFQHFCDRIGERAAARVKSEEELAEILADESYRACGGVKCGCDMSQWREATTMNSRLAAHKDLRDAAQSDTPSLSSTARPTSGRLGAYS